MQQTLHHPVHCSGVGLHSGRPVEITLRPAPVNHGIVFLRSDVPEGMGRVSADYRNVTDTTLCTVIENGHGTRIGTVEHLMAALWGMGVDNALIELNGPEVPIMDGSSEPFLFLLECAGVTAQNEAKRVIVIDAPILVEDGDSIALIEPHDGFCLDVTIDFAHEAIGMQQASYDFGEATFKQLLSRARTFGFEQDVARLRAAGLARGGSLSNAVVIGEDGVMNPGGLRYTDEFVRHKALDCVGDYFMAGCRVHGRVTTRKPGHRVNNKLVKAIYAHKAAWHYEALREELSAMPVAQFSNARRGSFSGMSSAAVHQPHK